MPIPQVSVGSRNLKESILPALLILFSFFSLWIYSRDYPSVDFYQYWASNQGVLTMGVTNIYSPGEQQKIAEEMNERSAIYPAGTLQREVASNVSPNNFSTPFLYFCISLFRSADYETALTTYRLFIIFCLLGGLGILCKLLQYDLKSSAAFIAVFALWFEPMLSDTRVGNVTVIQLFLFSLFLIFLKDATNWKKEALAGFTLSAGVLLKPTLLFAGCACALGWLVRSRFTKLFWAGVGGAVALGVAVVFSSVYFGTFRIWGDWFHAVNNLYGSVISIQESNYSLVQMIRQIYGLDFSKAIVILLFFALFAIAWTRRKGFASSNTLAVNNATEHLFDFGLTASGALAFLLSTRMAWPHYYVLSIPAILFALRPSVQGTSEPHRWGTVLRLILATVAFINLTAHPVLYLLKVQNLYIVTGMLAGGAALLFVLMCFELLSFRPDR